MDGSATTQSGKAAKAGGLRRGLRRSPFSRFADRPVGFLFVGLFPHRG